MEASGVSNTLFSHLSFRSERHKVISSNIANLNTPNYKTKDLVFESELKKAGANSDLQMTKTHVNHISFNTSTQNNIKPQMEFVQGLKEQNDGNNVSLDKEIGDMAKNSIMVDALSNAIKKDSRLFKSVLESSAKN